MSDRSQGASIRPVRVGILGAGVIGLSSAICLQEELAKSGALKHVEMHIMAERFTPHTTSDGSGGFWMPFQSGDTPTEKIRDWGEVTFNYIRQLYKSPRADEVGAVETTGYLYFLKENPEAPFGCDITRNLRKMTKEELQDNPPFRAGFVMTTQILQCTKYLPWLQKKFTSAGGILIQRKVTSIDEISNDFDVIINCTGLGSYWLLEDKEMYPVRGQVLKVKAPWLRHFRSAEDYEPFAYILPGADIVTLGGTAEKNNWDTMPTEATRRRILEDCCMLEPSLQNAEIVQDWVGLRPARTKIRLEKEEYPSKPKTVPIIHNYGHGGCGVTLHWGCALEAASLAKHEVNKVLKTKKLITSSKL